MTNETEQTLEEAAERIISDMGLVWENTESSARMVARHCAKWQRMYSEEEVLDLLNEYNNYLFTFIDKDNVGISVEKEDVKKWFEKFNETYGGNE
jgi:hypothetical protein